MKLKRVRRRKNFFVFSTFNFKKEKNMDTKKIKATLQSALHLLNKEIGTEITKETKEEYLRVINEIHVALKEFK